MTLLSLPCRHRNCLPPYADVGWRRGRSGLRSNRGLCVEMYDYQAEACAVATSYPNGWGPGSPHPWSPYPLAGQALDVITTLDGVDVPLCPRCLQTGIAATVLEPSTPALGQAPIPVTVTALPERLALTAGNADTPDFAWLTTLITGRRTRV